MLVLLTLLILKVEFPNFFQPFTLVSMVKNDEGRLVLQALNCKRMIVSNRVIVPLIQGDNREVFVDGERSGFSRLATYLCGYDRKWGTFWAISSRRRMSFWH